jgi:uncharacterized membrane protein
MKVATTTLKNKLTPSTSARSELLRLTSKLVRRTAVKRMHGPREALASLIERTSADDGMPLVARLRSVPIQCSIDIAVPLEVTYAEWMKLEFLPEGAHRVEDIKRRGDRLRGRVAGALAQHSAWAAEVREERPDESFAWRSLKGSDCLGLATFHRISERLTRLELELDVVPAGPAEAFELLVHIADRRAEIDLRRFKAQLERISPDDYPSLVEDARDVPNRDNEEDN